MKKSNVITVIVCICILCGTLWVVRCPRTVPFAQCSAVYQKYADVDGIDATFIKDYRVNDRVTVDVTLLEAKDSAGWDLLKRDFEVPELDSIARQLISNEKDKISIRVIAKTDVSDSLRHDVLATSRYFHTLSIFHSNSEEEISAIIYYNCDKSLENIK